MVVAIRDTNASCEHNPEPTFRLTKESTLIVLPKTVEMTKPGDGMARGRSEGTASDVGGRSGEVLRPGWSRGARQMAKAVRHVRGTRSSRRMPPRALTAATALVNIGRLCD